MSKIRSIVALAISGMAAVQVPSMAADASVIDPKMVIVDRGNDIEVLPQVKATPLTGADANGHMRLSIQATGPVAIGNATPGVVFNHSLRAQGFINGEIAFAVKGDAPTGFDASLYPGFRKLVSPNVYLVVARTSEEFVALFNRLQTRTDLEWVEAQVQYRGGASSPRQVVQSAARNGTTR